MITEEFNDLKTLQNLKILCKIREVIYFVCIEFFVFCREIWKNGRLSPGVKSQLFNKLRGAGLKSSYLVREDDTLLPLSSNYTRWRCRGVEGPLRADWNPSVTTPGLLIKLTQDKMSRWVVCSPLHDETKVLIWQRVLRKIPGETKRNLSEVYSLSDNKEVSLSVRTKSLLNRLEKGGTIGSERDVSVLHWTFLFILFVNRPQDWVSWPKIPLMSENETDMSTLILRYVPITSFPWPEVHVSGRSHTHRVLLRSGRTRSESTQTQRLVLRTLSVDRWILHCRGWWFERKCVGVFYLTGVVGVNTPPESKDTGEIVSNRVGPGTNLCLFDRKLLSFPHL